MTGRFVHGRNPDLTLLPTKFDRVLDQVPNNLLKPRFIGYDEAIACGEIQLHSDILSRPLTPACLYHVPDLPVNIHARQV